MRIKVEPKDFFMYSIFLAFNNEQPDMEDETVKKYLEERELIPKVQGKDTVDGMEHDVMYFGGCYLGRHLQTLEGMQRQAVELEMLGAKIRSTIDESTNPQTRQLAEATPEPQLQEILHNVVQAFHYETSFGADEEGMLIVSLEPAAIQEKFLEIAGTRS